MNLEYRVVSGERTGMYKYVLIENNKHIIIENSHQFIEHSHPKYSRIYIKHLVASFYANF